MKTIRKSKVTKFIESDSNRLWINYRWGEVYVRKAVRFIGGKELHTLDVASISVLPSHQRKGSFTRWLKHVETVSGRPLYIENVYEAWFVEWFVRRGYTVTNPGEHPACLTNKH